jgi:hypothetical protein
MPLRVLATSLTAFLCLSSGCVAESVTEDEADRLTTTVPTAEIADAEASDDLVRLPGQGHLNPDAPHGHHASGRLVPGGGLIMSFDASDDGRVTPVELKSGAAAAFLLADTNEDGTLSALEQQDWANGLPTRDDTLANPVRFDPNLDRMITRGEFVAVVAQLAAAYAEPDGDILLEKLAAPEQKDSAKRQWSDIEDRDDRADPARR